MGNWKGSQENKNYYVTYVPPVLLLLMLVLLVAAAKILAVMIGTSIHPAWLPCQPNLPATNAHVLLK